MSRAPTRRGAGPTRTGEHERHLGPGSVVAGRYEIEKLIGVGGMGMVYRAHDRKLGLGVALKVLHADLARDPGQRRRFLRELILARQVSHRHVVRIHDLGEDGPLQFLTMDLVEGRSLQEVLAAEGPLASERALDLVRQLARGLAGAHAQGVVHRDLKPANILIDEAGVARITDFGIARSRGVSKLTRSGAVVGTLDYLSPEQAAGGEVDARSDLYALGLVFHETLTGTLPFPDGSAAEVVARRIRGDPDLAGLQARAPELAPIVRRLLATAPADRYASAPELLDDLDAPGSATVPERPRVRLPGRRPRWLVAAAVVTLVVAVTLGAGYAATRIEWERAPPPAAATEAVAPSLAVLPFADETGRADLAWAGRAVAEGLAGLLGESGELRVAESLRVLRTADALGLAAGRPEGRGRAALAELLDADHLVVGSVRSLGEELEVEARLVPAGGGAERAPHRSVCAGPARLREALGPLAAALRADLAVDGDGDGDGERGGAAAPLSPAAMASYDRGVARLVVGDALGAATELEAAVAADPTLTPAWLRLADAHQAAGRSAEAAAAVARAAETAPPNGRLAAEVRARLALLEGDPERAGELFAEVVRRYPADLEARVSLAAAHGAGGRVDEARRELERVVELDPQHPLAWYLLGKFTIQSGDARLAVDEHLVRALVIQNRLENDQGRADVLNAMGVAYQHLGQLEPALEHYRRGAEIRERIGDRRGLATSLRNLAQLHSVQGRPDAAAEELERARRLLDEIGDRRGLADLANDLGLLAEERGDVRGALAEYRRALETRRELGDRRGVAESSNNVGYAYYLLGEHDNAMVYWRQALELFEEDGNREGVVLTRQSIGQLHLTRGDTVEATKVLVPALEESRELGMPGAAAVSLGYLGLLARLEGRFAAALGRFAEALAEVERLDDRRGVVEMTLLRAETWLELGRLDAVATDLASLDSALADGGHRGQRARRLAIEARLALRRGDLSGARRAAGAATAEAAASHDELVVLESGILDGELALAEGAAGPAAEELARRVEEASRRGHVWLAARAAEGLARAELARGRPAAAATVVAQTRRRLGAEQPWVGLYRLEALAAEALADSDPSAASAARERGRKELERLRRHVPAEARDAFEALAEVRALAAPVA